MPDESKTGGATAGEDESGLLQPGLSNKEARDAAELETVDRAYQKYVFRARRRSQDGTWLTDEFIRTVHFDMLGEIWDWAGKYRQKDLNLGIRWPQIPDQIKILIGDFQYWNSDKAKMPDIEIVARLQNRLTRIHPFKNGNGRHARLMTDIFFHSRKLPLPKWPQIQLMKQGDKIRDRYINAMRKADKEEYRELEKFIQECIDGEEFH